MRRRGGACGLRRGAASFVTDVSRPGDRPTTRSMRPRQRSPDHLAVVGSRVRGGSSPRRDTGSGGPIPLGHVPPQRLRSARARKSSLWADAGRCSESAGADDLPGSVNSLGSSRSITRRPGRVHPRSVPAFHCGREAEPRMPPCLSAIRLRHRASRIEDRAPFDTLRRSHSAWIVRTLSQLSVLVSVRLSLTRSASGWRTCSVSPSPRTPPARPNPGSAREPASAKEERTIRG